MSETVEGMVKWFDASKGFGFILRDNLEYFVHFSSIIMEGYKKLDEGQKVSFVISDGQKGKCAEQVTVINDY